MLRRGAALVAVLAVGAAGLAACSPGGAGDGQKVTAYFDKAVSLYERSDVKILGLSAGTVDEIEVEGTRVRVDMTIDGDQPIPAEVKATIVPLSLIGERYVQLFPAWTPGTPRAEGDLVIPVERTSVPTEPDEALAALKKFLDGLDPNATGRLVTNLADALDGNGQGLNDALKGLADLTTNLAAKDGELVGIIENFDRFTATLRTRERQLGRVMDQFATTTSLLADERQNIATLVDALARLSADGLDLVVEHGGRLDQDLTKLTRLLQSVRANMDTVLQLLDANPVLVAGQDHDGQVEGLAAAYDPTFHHIDLRNSSSPTVAQLLTSLPFGESLDVCLEIDVDCEITPFPRPEGMRSTALPTGRPKRADAAPTTTTTAAPVATPTVPGFSATSAHDDDSNGGGVFGWLRRAARTMAGAAS
ncbi:MAG: MCE family protein [Actinobacteria bacterium]|nr:MCE family protein [Actinomycetota bacterium]